MIILQLSGGLGNQLFQYAAGKSLSLHHNVPLKFDCSLYYRNSIPDSEVPRNFELYHFKGIHESIVQPGELAAIVPLHKQNSLWAKLLPRHRCHIYSEPFYHFDPNFFKTKKTVLLKGWFQSEKYFDNCRDVILQTLVIKDEHIQRVKEKAGAIAQQPTVGVHIRRADYINKKATLEWHGVMPKEYYAKGFEIMAEKVPGFSVLYFTDDAEWVEKELLPLMPGEIISKTTNQTHWEDFYLLSHCQHNIIANSSFSWWAAWLNKNPGKIIIGPQKWFDKGPKDTQDIIPSSWLKI